jgi:hypothetical protein
MSQAAAIARLLGLAVWIGGMAALDFVEAPLRFASGAVDRNQAVALGQLVITRWVHIEWLLGAVVLAASIVAGSAAWSLWVAAAMLALAGIQGACLAPAISRLAQGLDFVHRTPGDPRYASIRQLHTLYAVLELLVFAGGAALLAASARAGRR